MDKDFNIVDSIVETYKQQLSQVTHLTVVLQARLREAEHKYALLEKKLEAFKTPTKASSPKTKKE